MEDKEKEFMDLDFDGVEDYTPDGGFDLEDILHEDFSASERDVPDGIDAARAPTERSRSGRGAHRAAGSSGKKAALRKRRRTPPTAAEKPRPAPEPSPFDKPGPEENTAPAPEPAPRSATEPRFVEPGPHSDKAEPPRAEAPRDGPEGDFEEESPAEPLRIPNIPGKALALLAAVTLAAVAVCAALRLELPGSARTALLAGGIALACLPMLFMSIETLREKNRLPAPIVMILAVAVMAASGGIIEAIVTAVFFDLAAAMMELFFRRELAMSAGRLEEKSRKLEPALKERLEELLREAAYRRVRPIVKQRETERFVVLGVVLLAAFFGGIVPLIDGLLFTKWLARAAALLAVCVYTGESQILMTLLNAAESAAGEGIYFSGSAAMSAATEVTSVIFNKSGTLTDGRYKVTNVDPVRLTPEQVLFLAAYAGAWSDHPLAVAIREAAGEEPDKSRVRRHTEREGLGTMVYLDDQILLSAGNIELMEGIGVKGDMYIPGDTCVFVAVDNICVGRIDLRDELKDDAVTVVHELRRLRVANVALMTGDNALNATNTGRRLGIAEVYSDCRPSDKTERLQYILDSQERDDRLMAVSSAGRDKELLEMANVSATLGLGPEVTGTFPDIAIVSGKLADLTRAIRIAKRARSDVSVSFLAAMAARFLCALLAVMGVLGLWSVTALMLAADLALFLISFVSDR